MGPHQFLIPRLDGKEILTDLKRHLDLVERGVSGFIIFGGELGAIREGIEELQARAKSKAQAPLVICSDLEQGLGQQIQGGTLFPPAEAMGRVFREDPTLVVKAFEQMALEASFAGINTVLAPVLDINTNPSNPIISTRSFGGSLEDVSAPAGEMIRALKSRGVASCGKHFPGHGDTVTDSHIGLPTVEKSLDELKACELLPFEDAVKAGVDMVMLGHLRVPALDPTGTPASLSPAVYGYIRSAMGFGGITVTDALDMGALVGLGYDNAASAALDAGADILLHPEDPHRLANFLETHACKREGKRLFEFRKSLLPGPVGDAPTFDRSTALEITLKAVRAEGEIRPLKNPFVMVLDDGGGGRGGVFVSAMKNKFHSTGSLVVGASSPPPSIPPASDLIVLVFSDVSAYKGGVSGWVTEALGSMEGRAHTIVSFGSSGMIGGIAGGHARIYAYWGSPEAEEAAAVRLLEACRLR